MQAGTYFPKGRRILLCFSPLISKHFWPASTLLRGPIALATLSPLETDSPILERWWSPGQISPSVGFWSRMLAWRRRLLWILHVGSVSVCLSSSVKSMKTSAAPYPGIRNPIVVCLMSKHCYTEVSTVLWWYSCFFNIATALLSPFTWDLFARLFFNKAVHIRALFHKSATTLGLVEQAFWRVPLFTEWIGASSFEVILAKQSKHSTTGTSCLWDFGFSTDFSRSVAWKNSETDSAVSFLHAYWYRWRKLQLSPLEHCPLVSHCQQSPRILCPRCFVSWFLTTAFLSKSCSILPFTIVFNLW